MGYRKFVTINLLLVSILFYVNLNYFTVRSEFNMLMGNVFFLFLIFGVILWRAFRNNDGFESLKVYQISGILLRLALLFSIPNLSDDFYRFLWDGSLVAKGINPFEFLPVDINQAELNPFRESLLEKMNSPEYFSVYPPLNQFLFGLAGIIIPNSVPGQILFLKLILLVAEVITIFLLPRLLQLLEINEKMSLIYILNPLVIIEAMGNLHFEVVTVAFLGLFVFYILKYRLTLATIMFGLAANVKLIPFIFLPAVFRHFGWKRGLVVSFGSVTLLMVFALPFIDQQLISNFSSGIELYFRKFEFNASIYYLVRWLGYEIMGYNIIAVAGILLAIISGFLALLIPLLRKAESRKFFESAFFALLAYYLLSTTVHPWYLINLIFLSVLSGRYITVFVWSCTVFLSYFAYGKLPFAENLNLLWIQYMLVFVSLIIETAWIPVLRDKLMLKIFDHK